MGLCFSFACESGNTLLDAKSWLINNNEKFTRKSFENYFRFKMQQNCFVGGG